VSEEVRKLLADIIEVRQRMYDRYVSIRKELPTAVSDQDLDEKLLDLLRAKLELAEHN
jgi:hypothetical protein